MFLTSEDCCNRNVAHISEEGFFQWKECEQEGGVTGTIPSMLGTFSAQDSRALFCTLSVCSDLVWDNVLGLWGGQKAD